MRIALPGGIDLPEFCLVKGKESVGMLEVTEKGFSITSDQEINGLLESFRSHFKEVGSSSDGDVTIHKYESKLPANSYFEVFVKVRSIVVRQQIAISSDSIGCIK